MINLLFFYQFHSHSGSASVMIIIIIIEYFLEENNSIFIYSK